MSAFWWEDKLLLSFIRGCDGDKGEFPNHCYITRAFSSLGVDDKGKYKVLEGRGCLYQLLLMDEYVFEMGGQCKCVSTFFFGFFLDTVFHVKGRKEEFGFLESMTSGLYGEINVKIWG